MWKESLFKYVNEAISDPRLEAGERLLCYGLYDELNKAEDHEGKVESLGEVT